MPQEARSCGARCARAACLGFSGLKDFIKNYQKLRASGECQGFWRQQSCHVVLELLDVCTESLLFEVEACRFIQCLWSVRKMLNH